MRSHLKTTVVAMVLATAGLGAVLPAAAQDKTGAPVDRPMMGGKDGGFVEMLRQYDANNDGKVTLEEFQAGRKSQVDSIDANKDGKISAEEMVNAHMSKMRPVAEERAKARVEAMDTDGDGLLSASELAVPPAPMRLFKQLDKNGTGIDLNDVKMPQQGEQGHGPKGHHGDKRN